MNDNQGKTFRVAVSQCEPPFLNIKLLMEQATGLIEQAGANEADLIAFSECYLPGYPNWYEEMGEGQLSRSIDKALFLNSITSDGKEIKQLSEVCRANRIAAVVGINERISGTTGTMYNTQVYITRDGQIAGKHQKYVPTVAERLLHAPGHTGYKNHFVSHFGAVSSLICGENSNPLGAYVAAKSHPALHVSAWPAYFGSTVTLEHAIKTVSPGMSQMLGCHVVNPVSRLSADYIEQVSQNESRRIALYKFRESLPGALITDPSGRIVADGTGNADDLIFYDANHDHNDESIDNKWALDDFKVIFKSVHNDILL